MINRMIRAAKLDRSLFREVETNTALTGEARNAVILASALSGVGLGLGSMLKGEGAGGLIGGVVGGTVAGVIGYLVWAWIAYFIGTRIFDGQANYGELRRTLGYAYSPNALRVVSFLPGVGWMAAVAASLWSLIAGVIAVDEALNFRDVGKAIATVVVGWLLIFGLIAFTGVFLTALFAGFS